MYSEDFELCFWSVFNYVFHPFFILTIILPLKSPLKVFLKRKRKLNCFPWLKCKMSTWSKNDSRWSERKKTKSQHGHDRALMVPELTSLSNIKIILILILRILRRCSNIWEWCLLLFFLYVFWKYISVAAKYFWGTDKEHRSKQQRFCPCFLHSDVTTSQKLHPLFIRVYGGKASQVIFSRVHHYRFYYFCNQLHHRVQ